jgi:O-antigen/teichoic acid export membrane protein
MLLFVITSARYIRIQLPLYLLTTGVVAVGCYLLVPSGGLQGAAVAIIISEVVRLVGSVAAVWHALRALRRQSIMPELQPSAYKL